MPNDRFPQTTHRCGELRRLADGSWWFQDVCFGHDEAPFLSAACLERNLATVTLRLFTALQHAASRLRELGAEGDEAAVLRRFDMWRTTGQWPTSLPKELRGIVLDLRELDG